MSQLHHSTVSVLIESVFLSIFDMINVFTYNELTKNIEMCLMGSYEKVSRKFDLNRHSLYLYPVLFERLCIYGFMVQFKCFIIIIFVNHFAYNNSNTSMLMLIIYIVL